jgi:hypothetical protein
MTNINYVKDALAYYIENDSEREDNDYVCEDFHEWVKSCEDNLDISEKFSAYVNWGELAMNDDGVDGIVIREGDNYYTLSEFIDVRDWWETKTVAERGKWIEGCLNNTIFIISSN